MLVPRPLTGASATGTAMRHTAATTTLYAYIHGVANASRACSAFSSGVPNRQPR